MCLEGPIKGIKKALYLATVKSSKRDTILRKGFIYMIKKSHMLERNCTFKKSAVTITTITITTVTNIVVTTTVSVTTIITITSVVATTATNTSANINIIVIMTTLASEKIKRLNFYSVEDPMQKWRKLLEFLAFRL